MFVLEGERSGAKDATDVEKSEAAGKQVMRRFYASQKLGDLKTAAKFPSISGSRKNLGPSAAGEVRVCGGSDGLFSLLADEDVYKDARPLVGEEKGRWVDP